MKKSLTLFTRDQFGYHTDFYEYAHNLRNYMQVRVVCLDKGLPKFSIPGVQVRYTNDRTKKGRLANYMSLLFEALELRREENTVLLKHFFGSELAMLLIGRRKVILDVRTFSVHKFFLLRFIENTSTLFACALAKKISVVSLDLAKKFKLRNYSVIGLGANVVPNSPRVPRMSIQDSLNLIYVGTLNNRQLHIALEGISLAFSHKPALADKLQFRIVGGGSENEVQSLRTLSKKLHLGENVSLVGYQRGSELKDSFRWANLGLVHVPPTGYYQCQPSTKLFEYWANGIPVLGSRYLMNEKLIQPWSGKLYEFNPVAFAECICGVSEEDSFDIKRITSASKGHTWESIVVKELKPLLESVT